MDEQDLDINKKLMDNINKLSKCYMTKCKNEKKKYDKMNNKIKQLQILTFDKYQKNEITRDETKRIINELDDKLYSYINSRKFINCKLTNCKEELIENLELLLKRLNKYDEYNKLYETKKEDYDIRDYINIKNLNNKRNDNL